MWILQGTASVGAIRTADAGALPVFFTTCQSSSRAVRRQSSRPGAGGPFDDRLNSPRTAVVRRFAHSVEAREAFLRYRSLAELSRKAVEQVGFRAVCRAGISGSKGCGARGGEVRQNCVALCGWSRKDRDGGASRRSDRRQRRALSSCLHERLSSPRKYLRYVRPDLASHKLSLFEFVESTNVVLA